MYTRFFLSTFTFYSYQTDVKWLFSDWLCACAPCVALAFRLIYFIHNAFNILLIRKKHLNMRAREKKSWFNETRTSFIVERKKKWKGWKLGHWLLLNERVVHTIVLVFFFLSALCSFVFHSQFFFIRWTVFICFYLLQYFCVCPMGCPAFVSSSLVFGVSVVCIYYFFFSVHCLFIGDTSSFFWRAHLLNSI